MDRSALLSYLDTGDLLSLAPLAQARTRARPSQRAPKRRGGKTAYVGDSLGVGTAPHLRGAKKVNVKGGRSSADGVNALKRMKGYDRVVLDLGTNDPSARELAKSIRRAKRYARGATIVVPLVHGPNAKQKNRVIKRSGVKVLRWGQADGGDGIHSSPRGYKRRARLLAKSLR